MQRTDMQTPRDLQEMIKLIMVLYFNFNFTAFLHVLTETTCALKKPACIFDFLRLHRLAHSPEANGEWLQSVDHGQPAEL